MKRRNVLKTIGMGALTAVFGVCALQQKQPAARLNIIYIMTDDHDSSALCFFDSVECSAINTTTYESEGAGKVYHSAPYKHPFSVFCIVIPNTP